MSAEAEFPFPYVHVMASLVARGYVTFVNVRPDKTYGDWICDECLDRVTPANRRTHVRKKHG